MTTKKSKPASLTSSLLARKGEAEPATAPYSIPESGRQRPADASSGKGNGNGSGNGSGNDLGHALSGLTRPAASENGTHSETAYPKSQTTPQRASGIPVREPEAPEVPETQVETGDDARGRSGVGAVSDASDETVDETRESSAESVFVESAVAEEVSIDEAVIEASVSGGGRTGERMETVAKSVTENSEAQISNANSETPAPGDPASGGNDAPDPADRETVRDARLLRFVYAMAALTGIVAIVLYAGGWLRDVPEQQRAQAPASEASSSAPADTASTASSGGSASSTPEMQAPKMVAPDAPAAESSAMAPVIPAAPPVAAPGAADEKPSVAETGVTTGGPAKPAAESVPPPTAGSEPDSSTGVGVAITPGVPSGQDSALPSSTEIGASGAAQPSVSVPVETPSPTASGMAQDETAKSGASGMPASDERTTAGATASEAAGSAGKTVPEPAMPPVASETVREVPNMRVLAPALVRPEPAETAPPAGTAAKAAGGVPTLSAPPVETPKQTAALPKAVPPKSASGAAKGGQFLVQLASVSSEAVAKREWARLQKVFPDVFGERSLVIEKKEIAGRGTFYRIQTGGYKSLDEARSVCTGLKAKKQACLPVKR